MSYKKAPFVFSIIFNVLFLLFLLFSLTRKTAVVSFLNPETPSLRYVHNAYIVSVPAEGAGLVFGPAEITLKKGTEASLQLAVMRNDKQSNMAIEPLYDHSIITVEQSGFGLIIRGINPGQAVLQLFSPSGFKDVAYVTIYE